MQKKYYAVKKGRKTGIFETWEECKNQVYGFPNSEFKSFKTKEEAVAFLTGSNTSEQYPAGTLIAYVDGSYEHKTKIYGSGIVFLENDSKKTYSFAGNNPEYAKSRNIAGEISAAIYVMEYAESNKYEKLIINHDYIGLEKWAKGDWKTNKKVTIAYKNCYDIFSKLLIIEFVWVKSHSGDHYNDLADKLAKKALTNKNFKDLITKYIM
ncbi:MAG TPA: ribonuclease H family protein [Defluviitoga sp.]|nr:ribonuclease H family protein [Defluviitoga sp.]